MDLWETVFNKFATKKSSRPSGPKSERIGAQAPTIDVEHEVPLLIYEDNQTTIAVLEGGASKAVGHLQHEHRVNIRRLSEVIGLGYAHLFNLVSILQIADIFTKPFWIRKSGRTCPV